jgi:streptogramin lyase
MLATSKSISGFDPRSIPGCALWLDAADASTVVLGTGSNISQWRDKSGNGIYASPSNGASGVIPTYSNSAVYINNGGSATYNSSTYTCLAINSNFQLGTSFTLFAVFNFTTTTGYQSIYQNSRGTNAGGTILSVGNTQILEFGADQTTQRNISSGQGFTNFGTTRSVVSFHSTPASLYLYQNGSVLASNVTAATLPTTDVGPFPNIGGGYTDNRWGTGYFNEIICYTAELTTTQRQSIEGYLAWKWGLQVQTPVAPVLTPRSISGCALWLDAADSSSIVLGTGSNVSRWNDKSGNGYYASPSNGASGVIPTYSNSAVYINNGGSQFYNSSTFTYLTVNTNFQASSNFTFFEVFNFTTTNTYQTVYQNARGTNADTTRMQIGNTQTFDFNDTSSVIRNIDSSVGFTDFGTTRSAVTYLSTPAAAYLYKNSSILGSNTTAITLLTTDAGTLPSIGGGYTDARWATGYFNEIICYNAALTTTQRQSVENYLMGKWGIKPSLPATHPFYSLPAFSRPFGPTDIPGCALWLDAADASTFTFSSGSNISNWKDKSPNGFTGTSSGSPTLVTNSQNGLQVVNFVASSSQYFNFGNVLPLTQMTLFVVGKTTFVSGTAQSFIARSLYGVQDGRWAMIYETNYLFFITGGGGSGYTASATATPYSGTFSLFEGVWDGTSVYSYGNGTQLASVSASVTATSNSDLVLVGEYNNASGGVPPQTGFYYNGTIGEIIMFSNALSTGQRQQVEGYLAAKWGLLNTLPGKVSTPLSVSGCALWLDGADPAGTGTVPSNGATVSTWVDKSGNSANGTASGTPTYSSSSKAISFNGTNAFFSLPNGTITPGSTNFTIFVVCYPTNISGYPYVYGAGGSSADTGTALIFYPTGQIENGFYTDFMGIAPSGSVAINNLYLFTSFYDGSRTLYKNGTSVVSGTPSGTKNISTLNNRIGVSQGGGSFFYGTINEVIVFNTALSTTQRQSVENYLMSKWGISNVTSHPFKSIPPSTSQPPQFQEVTPGNWTYDWKPYLSNLAAANSGATASIGTSITPSVSGGFAATLAPNGNLYTYSWSGTGITVVNTNSGSLVTTITGTGIQGERYFSSCLGPDGNIYYPPYNLSTAGILYTATNTFSASAITMGTSPSSGAYCGAVLAPNGKIYCIPRAYGTAASIGIIDPVAKTFNIMASAVVTANQGYIGGVLAPNGKIYCIPFVDGGSVPVGIIDPDANTFTTMPSSSVSTVGAYNGGVLAPNGKIYCIPYNATNVGIIDPVANTFNTTTITNAPGGAGYTGGCLGPNGKIYFAPRSATAFGVVDPTANTLATTGGVSGTSGTGYTGAFLTSAGKFYCPNLGTVVNVVNFSSLIQTPSPNYCLSAYANKS